MSYYGKTHYDHLKSIFSVIFEKRLSSISKSAVYLVIGFFTINIINNIKNGQIDKKNIEPQLSQKYYLFQIMSFSISNLYNSDRKWF